MTEYPWISGHCGNGNCEGTKNLSPGGALYQSCSGAYGGGFGSGVVAVCQCRCHRELDDIKAFIAEQLGEEAAAAIPQRTASLPASVVTPTAKATVSVQHAPSTVAPTDGGLPPDHPDDTPGTTESGRRVRGSLDYEVKRACDYWITTYGDAPLTPKICAGLIDEDSPPSTGAIDAVWRRWVRIGFATMGSSPVHFAGYTEVGIEKGLHRMRFEAEQHRKGKRWT